MTTDLAGAWSQALATPGLIWLLLAALSAGVLYGFAGFGAALIFLPIATIFITPREAVAAFLLTSVVSLALVVPRAWPKADKTALGVMVAVAVVASFLGLYILDYGDVTALRWAILGVVLLTLVALVSGWRRRGEATHGTRAAVAGAAGFLGGAVGLAGPIFVLFQLSSSDAAERHRANIACFLTLSSVLLIPLMMLRGMTGPDDLARGVILLAPYGLGNLLGQRLFDPAREVLYRRTAYGLIACAILLGLPIFD